MVLHIWRETQGRTEDRVHKLKFRSSEEGKERIHFHLDCDKIKINHRKGDETYEI